MEFEWDPTKARKNKARHGVSFDAARSFEFDEALIYEDYGEERFIGIGFIGNKIHYLVYTMREGNVRVISLRRATRQEANDYVEYLEKGY